MTGIVRRIYLRFWQETKTACNKQFKVTNELENSYTTTTTCIHMAQYIYSFH